MKHFKKVFWLFAFLVLVPSAWGLMVLQLNLNQLTELADTIFVGKCASVVSGKDAEGRTIQTITFDVMEMLKGKPAPQVTFRQLGKSENPESGMTLAGINQELPTYEVGEEVVIFLSEPGKSGLTAPIGLRQGKFAVLTDAAGLKTVVNGMGNHGLFLQWQKSPALKSIALTSSEKAMTQTSGKPLPLGDFSSLVRKLATQ